MLRPNDIIGPYKLTRRLGSGAFGEVWLGEQHAAIVSPEVAIKFALGDDVDIEVVKREAELWKRASGHQNVIPIIEANVYDNHLVIVSEYARDGSLDNWLRRHNGHAPSVSEAIAMMTGILAGLEHLHAQRIVHCDLKPGNILLQGTTPRLADFGISRVITSKSSEHTVGTLPYQAPETFDGRYIEQTDLWAAGVILYQLLAGRRPFPQTDVGALISAILHAPYQVLLEAPLPLQEIIARALQKDPAQRYRSAAAMREALSRVSQYDEPGDQDTEPSTIKFLNRWKYVAAGVTLALVTTGVGYWVYTLQSSQPSNSVVGTTPTVVPSATVTPISKRPSALLPKPTATPRPKTAPTPAPSPKKTSPPVSSNRLAQAADATSKADRLYKQGQYDRAIRECDRALQYDPGNRAARKLKEDIQKTKENFGSRR